MEVNIENNIIEEDFVDITNISTAQNTFLLTCCTLHNSAPLCEVCNTKYSTVQFRDNFISCDDCYEEILKRIYFRERDLMISEKKKIITPSASPPSTIRNDHNQQYQIKKSKIKS